MVSTLLLLASLFATISFAVEDPLQRLERSPQKTCKLTAVNRYRYSCEVQGSIQDPAVIKSYSTSRDTLDCAGLCKANARCKSFQFVKGQHKRCTLYSKYIEEMYTDYDNRAPGLLYNSECFSTDCDLISACNATKFCSVNLDNDYDNVLQLYACGYGYTARKVKNVDYRQYLYNGSFTACQVADSCTHRSGDYFGGTVDVHYYIPQNVWVCILYDEEPGLAYDDGSETIQHVSRRRYTTRNESVGAGYGYWTSYGYRYPERL